MSTVVARHPEPSPEVPFAPDAAPAAAPASALVSAGGGVGATTTVTISGDHTTDERALLAQLSGFLNSAAPSKVVHWSETTKAAHSANVAKTKVIDGVVQLVEPSPDELTAAPRATPYGSGLGERRCNGQGTGRWRLLGAEG
jgi:hypothetical protein